VLTPGRELCPVEVPPSAPYHRLLWFLFRNTLSIPSTSHPENPLSTKTPCGHAAQHTAEVGGAWQQHSAGSLMVSSCITCGRACSVIRRSQFAWRVGGQKPPLRRDPWRSRYSRPVACAFGGRRRGKHGSTKAAQEGRIGGAALELGWREAAAAPIGCEAVAWTRS
jgi:hypothetical protein